MWPVLPRDARHRNLRLLRRRHICARLRHDQSREEHVLVVSLTRRDGTFQYCGLCETYIRECSRHLGRWSLWRSTCRCCSPAASKMNCPKMLPSWCSTYPPRPSRSFQRCHPRVYFYILLLPEALRGKSVKPNRVFCNFQFKTQQRDTAVSLSPTLPLSNPLGMYWRLERQVHCVTLEGPQ